MVVAIIVLSVLVFLLCVGLILSIIKIADLHGSITCTVDYLRSVEESRCRMQALVYRKFNYHLPASDKYLSFEELKLEEVKRQGGEQ
jgi:predicted Holliday junction resolvase-like endonuclease